LQKELYHNFVQMSSMNLVAAKLQTLCSLSPVSGTI